MSPAGWFQFAGLLVVLAITVPPLGKYMAAVYGARPDGSAPGDGVFGPIDRAIYKVCRIDHKREQRWNIYAAAFLAFSFLSFLAVYAIQRFQGSLPFNPTSMNDVSPQGAFNVSVSFMTNTNWQWYSGELTMSHFTQMIGLTVQNFVSAAAGLAVAVALIRGIARCNARTLGNFWEVWGPQYENETNYLRVHLAAIRKKLEPEPSRPRYFLTEPGIGYRFEPDAI